MIMINSIATKSKATLLRTARRGSALSTTQAATRDISIGTDLSVSQVTLQKARPWHMNDTDSNLAEDNAVTMSALFKGRKVAVFGVPAPFTGTCTLAHYPPYQKLQDKFKAKGIDEIICYSVSDPYAHYNWGALMKNNFEKISFLADVDCEWAKENNLDTDYTGASLGHRSARFSMIVDDGIVKSFNMVEDADKDAENLLEQA
ncbi:putative peroxiredoxin [Fragilariopsis cylindrus CCMP1102]|uniref:Putative peroxiredoxin n=2 Tax=Fragilariopsis cylindrus CCMP1102 TaxID=635003 RepID=A0A1E7EZT6_9STRA|nr:putative peroxiredoxin [Fragilariopsis cylindrus CCMP1102]|eukprot:OEU11315.1 putative peroxiredoxin [Fragilariopsis cylindrus CCMP1102]